jgi:hypothetical protein
MNFSAKKQNTILLLIVMCISICSPVLAATTPNFTPYFNDDGGLQGTDFSHYNRTEVIDKTGYTPLPIFLFVAIAALCLLIFSYRYNNDLTGWLAIAFSLGTAISSRTIDIVTSSGVTSQVAITEATKIVQSHEYVSMEMHTIYHPEFLTVIYAICFILSILNVYRIHLISQQETVRGGDQQ